MTILVFSKDTDARECEYCGFVGDAEDRECERCGNKMRALYICPVCLGSYTSGNIRWHYERHFAKGAA